MALSSGNRIADAPCHNRLRRRHDDRGQKRTSVTERGVGDKRISQNGVSDRIGVRFE
jgi:hypothetical protein